MKYQFRLSSVAVSIAAIMSMTSIAAENSTDQISNEFDVSFRYRIETVDQQGPLETAKASTLKTRGTLKTKWYSNFDTVLEADYVAAIGMDDYNAGAGNTPNKTNFATVADPEGFDLNQAFVRYTMDATKVAFGRQRIIIGDQRFVGGVGWRQNEQTYDSFRVTSKWNDNVDFSYANVFKVNRIFGDDVAAGEHDHNTHLLNADIGLSAGTLSGYFYSIDNEDAAGLSNDTFGIRYQGAAGDVAYNAEFATQSDGGDNPNNYSANYLLLEATYKQTDYSLGAGWELLGGDSAGGQGFTTSLATLHKFQGWADVFLNTPSTGIEDLYFSATYQVEGFNFKAVYHDFSSDEGSASYGSELDLSVAKKINKNLSALFKYADFSSDSASFASVEKIWLMLTYKI